MWRRLAQALVVWISLTGLIPAALACAQVMADHDCCPPGQQMPCDGEQGQVSVESAACCATSSLAPAAIKAVAEQSHSDADLLLCPLHAPWQALHSFETADAVVYRWCGLDSPNVPLDCSLTYLQTGRLRL
jgi:hypothetical protein